MDFLQAIGTLLSLTAFGLIGIIALKAFQIATDMGEIKDLLRDIRRNSEDHSPVTYRQADRQAQEVLLREMDDEAYARAVQAEAASEAGTENLARALNEESLEEAEAIQPPSTRLPR